MGTAGPVRVLDSTASPCITAVLEGTGKSMTVPIPIQEDIRKLAEIGLSQREIAKRLGISRDSVAKYSSEEDFSPKPPTRAKRPGGSVIAANEPIIAQWLEDDQSRWHKQRHTARRVFNRLVVEHSYQWSY